MLITHKCFCSVEKKKKEALSHGKAPRIKLVPSLLWLSPTSGCEVLFCLSSSLAGFEELAALTWV